MSSRPVFTQPSPRFRAKRFACLGGCGRVTIYHPHMAVWCPSCWVERRAWLDTPEGRAWISEQYRAAGIPAR